MLHAGKDYLKERNFRVDLFSRVIFLTFCVDLISRIGQKFAKIAIVALLEQSGLLTLNGLTSCVTLLAFQLRLVVLLEKTRLLRFNGLMN